MTKTDIKIKENPRDRQNGLDDYYMHIFLLVCDLNNLQKTRPTDRQAEKKLTKKTNATLKKKI